MRKKPPPARREDGRLARKCRRHGGLIGTSFPLAEIDGTSVPERAIRFSTIDGFKGLESKALLVADLVDLGSNDALLSIYVGASRAKSVLALFLDEKAKEEYGFKAAEYGMSA